MRGATPTQAALCGRVSVPNSGSARRTVRAHTGPMPWARGTRSSWSRHRGLARSGVSRSWASGALAALSPVLEAILSFVRRARVPARRFCAAGRRPSRGWRRPKRARRSCGWASGRGRGGGRSTSAQCASARAANAAVLAHGPGARAHSRAGRGLTPTLGRPAAAQAAVAARSRPPGASRTSRRGGGPAAGPRAARCPWHRGGQPSAPQRDAGPSRAGLAHPPYPQSPARPP